MNLHSPVRTLERTTLLLVAAALGAALAASGAEGASATAPASGALLHGLYRIGQALGVPAVLVVEAPDPRPLGATDGDGRAEPATGSGARPDRRPRILAHADVDGDGRADEIVGHAPPSVLSVRLAAGGAEPGDSRLTAVVADLDQDGLADLAATEGDALAISLGERDGGLRAAAHLSLGGPATSLTFGDFDGDGAVDLAAAYGSGRVAVFTGDGRGGFPSRHDIATGIGVACPRLVAADLDGDGRSDLALADDLGNDLAVILGDGAGGFHSPRPVEAVAPAAAPPSDATITNEAVASLTLDPPTIAGGSGGSATGTVTLDAPAPPGGAVVALASSNVELAATVPIITIPAGATEGTFTVVTNARYRKYSGLAFSAILSATHAATRSATLTVTAAPPPPDFNSGSTAGANTQWSGLMCGGIAPIGGNQEILYSCSPAPNNSPGFGTCTFRQECSIGCRRVPPSGGVFNDSCATSGPNPAAVSRSYIVSGDRVPVTVLTGTAAAPGTQGVLGTTSQQGGPGSINGLNANSSHFPHEGGIAFPPGATSVGFAVATSYVPSATFEDVRGFWFDQSIPPLLITNGRGGHAWIAMAPPEPPPALPIPTLGDFKITGSNPVTGGQGSIGQIDVSGITSGGGPTIALSSSHPAIASVPATVVMPPSTVLGQQVMITTQAPPADTDVTITATDGRYTFSAVLRVRVPPPPPVLAGVTVNPASVVGGSPATGTVTLSAPQGGATVVALSTPVPGVAILPASVTVPAGATSANFPIATAAVTETVNANIFADLAGSPGQQALLLVTPGAAPAATLSSVSLNPTTVVGGSASTGTVTLTAAAPTGGVAVSLSSNSTAATVPASAAVAAGATSATFTITTGTVAAPTAATISGTLGATRTATLTVNPAPTPAAPSLISPANDATPAQPVLFDWSDVANAASYEIQIDDSSTFAAPLVASQTVGVSQASIGGLPARRLWWRVRARNSAGVSGPFSASRRFTPQAAPAAPSLSALSVSPASVVGPASAIGTATFTSAAPAGGAVVSLSSNNAAATVPASVTLTAGATSATFAVTTVPVTSSTMATISAVHSGVTRTATLTVTPPASGPLPAPTLLSPAVDARFAPGQAIAFDWSDVAGGSSYTIEIDDSQTISAPLVLSQTSTTSQFTTSALPTLRLWWRVRAVDAAGSPGAWSEVRRFEIR